MSKTVKLHFFAILLAALIFASQKIYNISNETVSSS